MTQRRSVISTRVYDIDWRSAVVIAFSIVAIVALRHLFKITPRVCSAVAVGGLLALGLEPLVRTIQTRMKSRTMSVAIVFFGALLFLALVFSFLIPPAIDQGRKLPSEVKEVITELDSLPVVGDKIGTEENKQKITDALTSLPDRLSGDLSPVTRTARKLADTFSLGIGALLVAVCLLLDGQRFVDRSRRFFHGDQRDGYDHARDVVYRSVGRYVTGSITVAAIAGLYVLAVGLILGVPLAPLAAAWVALWDLIPQIGGAVGGIPFVVLAFTHSPLTGLIAAIAFVVYLQIENNVIQPIVIGKAVKLSPLVTMLAALIGVGVAGILGALFAVPMVGAAKALYDSRAELKLTK